MLNAEKIKEQLKKNIDVFTYETVDSTNSVAKKYAAENKDDALFIANHQTCGRGRMGRTFFSPKNSGIYMSLLLHPNLNFEDYTLITTAAAVSVAKAIDNVSDNSTKIKWVNDIFLNGKKVCGILTEGTFGANDEVFAVLGIGVNLFEPQGSFPKEIKEIAGGVFNKECSEDTKTQLITDIINNFYEFYFALPQKNFLDEYREKDMLLGEKISFLKNGKTNTAVANGISDNLELIVIDNLDCTHRLSSGEVTIGSKKA